MPSTKLILYVDDEAANLTTFQYCFGDRFEVATAASGEEALALMERQPVAVLLADERMPGMTGSQLCALARERFPDVVRMIVTAYADLTAAMAAINTGQVSRYILKPWREENLAEVLRAGVEAYDLGRLLRELQLRTLQREQEATSTFLIGQMMHEFGNPLAAVRTNVHYLVDCLRALVTESAAGTPPQLAPRLGEAHEAADEARLALEDLVARLHRFRAGEEPASLHDAATDLNRGVQVALAIVGAAVRRHARLELELGPVPPVRASATHLSQIVVNLLNNAAEALPPDRPDGHRVAVRTSTRGDRAILEVEDDGPGIPADLLPRVFEPFVSTKSDEPSRGLGLAVVRDLVQRLHGDVRVTSEPGRGTCFTVELPLAGR